MADTSTPENRPIVFFDIGYGNDEKTRVKIGRIAFTLYADLVPKTVENFR